MSGIASIENGKKGGRPPGIRPKFMDYFTEDDIKSFVEIVRKKVKAGDSTMLKFVGEQVYGKAPQTIDHTQGGGKELPTPILQLTQVNIKNNNAILPDISDK